VVISLPGGDIVDTMVERLMEEGTATSMEDAQRWREYYGLDDPLLVQYWKWISKIVLHLDFGYEFGTDPGQLLKPVGEILSERIAYTISLTAFTITVTWVLGIPIGIYSAVRQHTIGDYLFTFVGFTGLAVPDFILGLVLMYVFFAAFDWSVGGLVSARYEQAAWDFGKIVDLLQHLIIPGIVLGTSGTAGLIRIMRNNLLDELGKPYVTTARAKGMANWKVIAKYPVRVAINPFISGIGQMLPSLVGGSVIVSVVLSLPTLGPVLLNSLLMEDVRTAGAIILLLGVLTVIGILVSDLLLVVVDPRIKLFDE
jgi:peptide/nickel transport system permease protein